MDLMASPEMDSRHQEPEELDVGSASHWTSHVPFLHITMVLAFHHAELPELQSSPSLWTGGHISEQLLSRVTRSGGMGLVEQGREK